LQAALASLWNAINANTAQGLGLDILASTVLNLTRKNLIPSSCGISVVIGNVYSTCQIQMTVTATSSGKTVPTGWTATSGSVSPSPAYTYMGSAIDIGTTGVYYFTVQSTDTSTLVPANAFNGGSAISGVTFTVTNPASAILGSVTIPTTFQVTASSLGDNSPVYSPNSPETYTSAGTYNFIVYSQNISVPINPTQLDSASDSVNSDAPYLSLISSVSNQYAAMLGTPAETDAQFSARSRYYLNVEGQTYYGLEKAILDLQVPALQSVFIAETITDNYNSSICIIKASINYTGTPVVIPVGWTVYGAAGPTAPYKTNQEYTYNASGPVYIPVFSIDNLTPIPIGNFTTADAPYPTGVTAVTNLDPAILDTTIGLGQRGYTVYLEYPTIPYSYCIITMTVTAIGVSPPYYVPIGWQATGPMTTAPYVTQSSYLINATGTYSITVYSTDVTTNVSGSAFTGGTSIANVTFTATNSTAAVLGQTNPGEFDTNDLYLQQIAQTCYAYHPLGTQFYSAPVGATTFIVQTPYAGYTYPVVLNPFQITQVSCNLELVYNVDPFDAGYSNGIFDISILPNLQTQITEIINQYFLSKTLPTDLVYSINELSEILQNTFTGIVALVGNGATIFSFGTLGPTVNGLVFLKRSIGYIFNLDVSNFNFSAINKNIF